MYLLKSLLAISLASTASATYFNGKLLQGEILRARATSATFGATSATATTYTNSSDVCSSVLQGLATLITGLPTPTGALSTYLATAATTLTDPCHLSVPSTLALAFSTYESSVISFYSAHISQLNSALAACPSLTNLVANPVCSTATNPLATLAATTTASTRTITSSSTTSGSSAATATKNIGSSQTGMVTAAVAAAGLFGVVVIAL